MKKKFRKFYKAHWRKGLAIVSACVVGGAFLLIRFASLAPTLSPAEKTTLSGSSDFHAMYTNPLHLPLHFTQWVGGFLSGHAMLSARGPSIAIGVISLLLLIYILRRWYGPRTTTFGFFIFITSAWFLHVSRFAGTDIEYLAAILVLLAIHLGLQNNQRPLMSYIWLVTNITLLFIPGLVWLVLISLYWQRLTLIQAWQQLRPLWKRIVWVIIAIIGLASLFTRLATEPSLIRIWLGLPEQFGSIVSHIVAFGNTLLAINFRGPHDPQLWLGRLPILDAFLSVMLLTGIFFYAKHWRSARSRMLLSYFIAGTILISLGGAVRLSLIVSLVYIVAVGGIAYLLHFWTQIFPKNPVAKSFGIAVVVTAIALSSFYNIRQYFVAWPHNDEVISVYRSAGEH